jgi:hypothetical protein
MGKYSKLLLAIAVIVLGFTAFSTLTAHASFNKDLLMDDTVFEDTGSMSAGAIDNFLNGNAGSCISPNSGFRTPDPQGWSSAQGRYLFGGNVTAGQAIYDTAQLYHVNPQVILATMQKEQSLVTGSAGCYPNTPDPASATPMNNACGSGTRSCTLACTHAGGCMTIAMGYGCPNYCNAADEGFSMQLTLGTWLLRFGEQRAYGNLTGYVGYESGDENFTYNGPMTPGQRQRSASDSLHSYDGSYTTVNGVGVSISTGATAALYNFTPFTSGNQSFVNIFEGWFGGTVSGSYYSCHNSSNVPGVPTGEHVIASKLGINHTDNLRLIIPNNTGSACVEAHTWQNNNYNVWLQHIASDSPAINPNSQGVIAADFDGDGTDELCHVDYSGTTSGMIEVHCWDHLMQHWISHVVTNRPAISKDDAEVIAADPSGSGHDSLFLVQYRNTASGRVEVHQWSANLQQWVSHIATNYGAMSPTNGEVISADFNGSGKDGFYLVDYAGSSGHIEVHGWSPDLQQWTSHIATVSPSEAHVDGSNNPLVDIIAADTNGDAKDELYKIDYSGTASGRIEVHGLNTNFQQWTSHIVTSEGSF